MSKFENRKLILAGIIVPIIVAIIAIVPKYYQVEKKEPSFILLNPYMRTNSKAIIEADNDEANQYKPINIKIDNYVISEGGHPVENSNPQKWIFTLYDKHIPEKVVSEGEHNISFAFPGEAYDREFKVYISKVAPKVLDITEKKIKDESGYAEIEVNSINEFVKAIKPNTKIIIKNSEIKLDDLEKNISHDNKYIGWSKGDWVAGAKLEGIDNITIIGGLKNPTYMFMDDNYNDVLQIVNCKKVKFENIEFGHPIPSGCMGDVIVLTNSENITFDNCIIDGSGIAGINATNVNYLAVNNSIIENCSYTPMILESVSNSTFNGVIFQHNWGSAGLKDCRKIDFTNCKNIIDRGTNPMLDISNNCDKINFKNIQYDSTSDFLSKKSCKSCITTMKKVTPYTPSSKNIDTKGKSNFY